MQMLALLGALAAVLTMALQGWVGLETIYAPEFEAKRQMFHEAILTNTPPEKGWAAVGAAALNIRVTAVYMAEGLHQLVGVSVSRAYWLLDTVFLFAVLFGLPLYLRRWLPATWCLLGMLYMAAMLPLTYLLHVYQPWDRMQLAAWLLLLALVRDDRPWLIAAVLALSITVKFDTVLIALLYGLTHLRPNDWRKKVAACGMLAVVGYATLAALTLCYPAPTEPARFGLEVAATQLRQNVQDLGALNVRHPTVLVMVLPAILALIGISRRPRFLVAGVIFGCVLTAVWAAFTVYVEVRAQMSLLLMLLPPALLTLREWLEPASSTTGRPSG